MSDETVISEPEPAKRPPGRPKGKPKTGGRLKDMINLHVRPGMSTGELRDHVMELCKVHKFEPISVLARIAMNKSTDPKLRARCASDVAQYLYPRVRTLEVSGPNGTAVPTMSATDVLDTLDAVEVQTLITVLRHQLYAGRSHLVEADTTSVVPIREGLAARPLAITEAQPQKATNQND